MKKLLILFELPFEAEVGADGWSAVSDEGNGFFESPVVMSHEIGDD